MKKQIGKEKLKKGKIVYKGSFSTLTLSCKSHPGDGTHGNGVKGSKDPSYTLG